MANHPNRNWRMQMEAECSDWIARWKIPADGAGMFSPDQLRDLMSRSFQAGYEAGREAAKPKAKP